MKVYYVVALIIALMILLLCLLKTKMNRHTIAPVVVKLLTASSVIVTANIGVMFFEHETLSMMAYSTSFIATDFMLYYMLRFALEYTGYKFMDAIENKKLMVIVGIDSVIMVLNPFIEWAFTVRSVVMPDDVMYQRLYISPLYYYHLVIAYGMGICTVLCLLYKFFKAPTLYGRKYLIIFLSMIPTIVSPFFYFIYHEAIDWSVLGHALTALAIYYCAFVYSPQKLLDQSLIRVVQRMDEAMLLLDVSGDIIYMNKKAQLFVQNADQAKDELGRNPLQWYNDICAGGTKDFHVQTTFLYQEQPVHMNIHAIHLYDKKGRNQGTIVTAIDMTAEIEKQQKEIYEATHDQLTTLYNEYYFYERCKELLQEKTGETYVMVCSDVHNFKLVNDVFGSYAGDQLLIQIGTHLKKSIRPEYGEVCGRLGNDRFAILLPKNRYRESVFLDAVRHVAYVSEDTSYPVEIGVGVYEVDDVTVPISVMCDRALMAIKENRANYQNKIAYYDADMRDGMLKEQELTSDLKQAIEEGQLQMYLQPQISVTGEVLGGEALVRWFHPQKGPIYPNEFIPVFEKNGMIAKLDRYIWECAARQLSEWKKQGHNDLHIAVNISPKDFYLLDVYGTFTNLVQKYDINPMNLKLEITESAIIMDLERQLELINRLQSAGFIIEMDDFGSGYSSLNMLKEIKVDVLKIDMAFVRKSTNDERGRKILKMIINLSKQLGMPVISEGVETADQVRFLTDIGCDVFQGYYFAKPMEVSEFEERYMRE